jgi:hypothetical protein
MVLLIHLQDLLGYQIKNHYLNQKDNLIICGYNNLTLITIFISCMIALGIIRV